MEKTYKYINPENINLVLDYADKLYGGELPTKKGRLAYQVFAYAIQLYGFNAFPKVVPDQEFESMPSTKLFRGVRDAEYNANLLCDYDYHYGVGTWGDGIYSITQKSVAYQYAAEPMADEDEESQRARNERILTFKTAPNTKSVDLNKIYQQIRAAGPARLFCLPAVRELFKFVHTLSDERAETFKKLVNDISIVALFAGYDEMVFYAGLGLNKKFDCSETHALFNRGKIVVSESEFKRVCALSRKYKDGTIDFKQKYANPEVEFLNE